MITDLDRRQEKRSIFVSYILGLIVLVVGGIVFLKSLLNAEPFYFQPFGIAALIWVIAGLFILFYIFFTARNSPYR